MAKETKEQESSLDILDQVRKVEKAIKAKILIKKISELKKVAKEVNELKEEMVATLEELGLNEKDVKRVIDFINELPDVKLTEREKQEIRENAREEVDKSKESQTKEVENLDFTKLFGNTTNIVPWKTIPNAQDWVWTSSGSATVGFGDITMQALDTGTSSYTLTCGGNGTALTVKL